MPEPTPLVVKNLSAGYAGRPVIRNLDLPGIKPGCVTALVGPNAAGKSTLLLALAGLLRASGEVAFAGCNLLRLDAGRRASLVTFMPQALPQGVALTVLDSVITAFKASVPDDLDLTGEEVLRRAVQTLDRLGIATLALEQLDRLSGGQRQLVSLAQALVRDPRLLLLDEPTSALDLRHQVLVMALVQELAAEGRTVIVVMHDLNLAARWADQIILFSKGTAYAVGRPGEALTQETIAQVYGVEARVERCSQGRLQVVVERALPSETCA